MNSFLVRGVALIGVAAACCGAGSEPARVLSGRKVFVMPKWMGPKAFRVGPRREVGARGPELIPTEIHARTELIPTRWPGVRIVPLGK